MPQFLLMPIPIQPPRHDLARYRPATGNGRFVPTRMQLVLPPMLVRIAKLDWRIEMPPSGISVNQRHLADGESSGRYIGGMDLRECPITPYG